MLVLSRKANETIRIGDDIVVTLVKVAGGKVRIGIDAPKSVKVLRGELEPCDAAVIDDDIYAHGDVPRSGGNRLPMATSTSPQRTESVTPPPPPGRRPGIPPIRLRLISTTLPHPPGNRNQNKLSSKI